MKLGATGRFPHGRYQPDDEGELRFVVGSTPGKVRIDFGKPIEWLAMPPDKAREFAQALMRHAAIAEAGRS